MNLASMAPEQVIAEWIKSAVKPKDAAAKLALELAAQAPGTLVASKEKIAISLDIHPSTARRVRMLLQGAGFVYKSGRHLYVSDRVIDLCRKERTHTFIGLV
jgi:DNA-binding transcriptional regulator YhcF (GntR family)